MSKYLSSHAETAEMTFHLAHRLWECNTCLLKLGRAAQSIFMVMMYRHVLRTGSIFGLHTIHKGNHHSYRWMNIYHILLMKFISSWKYNSVKKTDIERIVTG